MQANRRENFDIKYPSPDIAVNEKKETLHLSTPIKPPPLPVEVVQHKNLPQHKMKISSTNTISMEIKTLKSPRRKRLPGSLSPRPFESAVCTTANNDISITPSKERSFLVNGKALAKTESKILSRQSIRTFRLMVIQFNYYRDSKLMRKILQRWRDISNPIKRKQPDIKSKHGSTDYNTLKYNEKKHFADFYHGRFHPQSI